jgi:hypothetical protein
LEQLQISPSLLNELFGAIVAAVAIAFSLAFGLGGQDAARRWLARGESTISTAASQISTQQPMNQMGNGTPMQPQTDQMRTRQPNR